MLTPPFRPGGCGSSSASVHCTLFSFLDLKSQHSSTRTCANGLAGAGLSRPIAVAEAFPRVRGQVSLYLEKTSSPLNSHSVAAAAPLCRRWIGLGCEFAKS